jgi:hypothetical protein
MCKKDTIVVDGVEYVRKEQEPIRMGKRYTYLGRPARILCVDRDDAEYPVIALVYPSDDGVQYPFSFTKEGHEWGAINYGKGLKLEEVEV